MITIPKKFKLLNRTWTVKMVEELRVNGNPAWGSCVPETATISLCKSHKSREWLEHSFLHELTHALWHAYGVEEHDEGKVDAHAAILHQVLDSYKGEIT